MIVVQKVINFMDSITQIQCKSIFEGVFGSFLGTEVIDYFKQLQNGNDQSTDFSFFEQIRQKLNKNLFQTPYTFLNEITDLVENESRNLGSDSYISLSLLTILQLLTDKINQTFPYPNSKPSISDFNQFLKEFEIFSQNLPNDRKSFISYFNFQFSNFEDQIEYQKTVETPQHLKVFNYDDLYIKINSLPTDKDFENISNIIISHETSYTHSNDLIEIDLKKCQPTTVQLLKNYLQNIEENAPNE